MELSPITPNDKNNLAYPTVEHFYQAMKSGNTLEHTLIATADTPYEAKQMGKKVDKPFEYLLGQPALSFIIDEKLKKLGVENLAEIEKVKLSVMYLGLKWKFDIPEWKEKLLETLEGGDDVIVEWNNWSDRWWGVEISDNKGHNWLGRLLMLVREEIKNV